MLLHAVKNSHGNYDILDENNVVIAQTVFMPRADEFIKMLDNGRLALELLKMQNDEEDV